MTPADVASLPHSLSTCFVRGPGAPHPLLPAPPPLLPTLAVALILALQPPASPKSSGPPGATTPLTGYLGPGALQTLWPLECQ